MNNERKTDIGLKGVFGLTGGMGCGKSTIIYFLKKYSDVCVLDCDEISKDLLISSENTEKVKEILGDDVVKDGKINYQKVAKIIFNDSFKKLKLEDYIHPLVWKKVADKVQNGSRDTIFIVESALIYETNQDKNFKGVIVATCDEKEQFNRIKKRNSLSDIQIEERLKSQLTNRYKEEKGLIVINTNCSMQELELKVEQLYSFIISNESGRLVL